MHHVNAYNSSEEEIRNKEQYIESKTRQKLERGREREDRELSVGKKVKLLNTKRKLQGQVNINSILSTQLLITVKYCLYFLYSISVLIFHLNLCLTLLLVLLELSNFTDKQKS